MPRCLIAVLALVLIAQPAHADDWSQTLKEFRLLWAKPDPASKIAGISLLAKANCKASAKILVELLGKQDTRSAALLNEKKNKLVAQRAELLKTGREKTTANGKTTYAWKPGKSAEYMAIYAEIRKIEEQIGKVGDLREEIVGGLAQLSSKEALSYLRTRGLSARGWEKPTAVLEALALGGRAETAEAVRKKIMARDFRIATAAIDCAAKLGDKDAFASVVRQLDHKQWQVRAAAIKAAATLGGWRAIAPLVTRLGKEDGRLEEDIDAALERLTGISLGGSEAAWERWLSSNKDRLAQIVEAASKVEKKPEKAEAGRTSSFYGITTNSKRICYIIDISGSMSSKANLSPTEISGQGKGYPVDGTKLDICKFQLKRAINGLPKDASFNIIWYHTTVHVYQQQGLISASAANKAKALAWVDTLKQTGATNIFEALMQAFSLASPNADDGKNYRYGADTVFFMTDGSPSAGPVKDTKQIVEQVTAKNRRFKLKIHCIAVGTARTDFLIDLAKKNGGSFVHHGAPPKRAPVRRVPPKKP